ncbi:zeta toxin family protein [Kitasatospora sp. MMS16-BH015]|uniref:zeta toxin family protein n=1 Tax=Kitasatospora sp. MMS16-BH015 TaxID=2018025 RepID=UPI000CF2BBF7
MAGGDGAPGTNRRLDAVVETALSCPHEPREDTAAYRRAGHRVEVVVAATAPAWSRLGLLERFLGDGDGDGEGAARFVSRAHHDACTARLGHPPAVPEAEYPAQQVSVVRRGLDPLYPTNSSPVRHGTGPRRPPPSSPPNTDDGGTRPRARASTSGPPTPDCACAPGRSPPGNARPPTPCPPTPCPPPPGRRPSRCNASPSPIPDRAARTATASPRATTPRCTGASSCPPSDRSSRAGPDSRRPCS